MFANGFTDETAIASKSGAAWDSRQCETQTRNNATTYGECAFDNLAGWTTSPGGVSIVASGSPDSAIGNALNLYSGANLNNPAFVQQKYPAVPANFGLAIFPALVNVGSDLSDALLLQVQKTVNDKNLQVRFTMAGLYVFINGAWAQLSTHSNTSWCEWWLEVAEANGVDTITAYAGTELINSVSGTLPNGPAGNGGLVYIGQESAATPDRQSQVAYFALGATQLFDNLSITSAGYALAVPTSALSCLLLIEDVANSLVPNTDVTAELSVNGGAFAAVTLNDRGVLCNGVIDSTKPVRMLSGTIQRACAKGDIVALRVGVLNHKFAGIQSVSVVPTSTM